MAAALACASVAAHAVGTPAGTEVVNGAAMAYVQDGRSFEVRSNDVGFRVDEIIDVAVATLDAAGVVAAPGAPVRPLAFRITNSGNGTEAFRLIGDGVVSGDAFDPTVSKLAIDGDGDGIYDPAKDADYVSGSNDPALEPDTSATIFVVGQVPFGGGDGSNGFATLSATAATGSGAPGTSFAGVGVLGVDAVVGAGGAQSSARGSWIVSLSLPELVKSQSVLNPMGGTAATSGATITYTIAARHAGALAATDAKVRDSIPDGTAYVAGSLKLGEQPLTDAVDGDAGQFNGAAVEVSFAALPSNPPPISFQVKVK